MHYDGLKHMPCGGGNVQVHAELGGGGGNVRPHALWWGKDHYQASLGACRVGAENHAKCRTVGQTPPTSSMVARNPPTCIVVVQG